MAFVKFLLLLKQWNGVGVEDRTEPGIIHNSTTSWCLRKWSGIRWSRSSDWVNRSGDWFPSESKYLIDAAVDVELIGKFCLFRWSGLWMMTCKNLLIVIEWILLEKLCLPVNHYFVGYSEQLKQSTGWQAFGRRFFKKIFFSCLF